jgi:hypothetical protein
MRPHRRVHQVCRPNIADELAVELGGTDGPGPIEGMDAGMLRRHQPPHRPSRWLTSTSAGPASPNGCRGRLRLRPWPLNHQSALAYPIGRPGYTEHMKQRSVEDSVGPSGSAWSGTNQRPKLGLRQLIVNRNETADDQRARTCAASEHSAGRSVHQRRRGGPGNLRRRAYQR